LGVCSSEKKSVRERERERERFVARRYGRKSKEVGIKG
jgi:hypothetical protein